VAQFSNMKPRINASLALVLFSLIVVGCSSNSSSNSNSDSKYIYVTNAGSDSISMYSIDQNSGALSANATPTIEAPGEPVSITLDSSGNFAFVATTLGHSIRAYAASKGNLSLSFTVNTVDANSSVTIDSSMTYIYAVQHDAYKVKQYEIVAGGANLIATLSTSAESINPSALVFDASGKYAYIYTDDSYGKVLMYTVAAEGALTPNSISQVPSGTSPQFFTLNPAGNFAYVINSDSTIWHYLFTTGNGILYSFGPSITAQSSPKRFIIHPNGKFAYATNSGSSTISMYTIDATTGDLSANSPATITVGTGSSTPYAMVINSGGTFAYVTDSTGNKIYTYSINTSTGLLTETSSIATGTQPVSIAISR
jgi:6-phosphogluconolactonase